MTQVLRKQPKAALESIGRALCVWTRVLPGDHPFIVYALNTQMEVYRGLKKFREAEEIVPGLLERCSSRFGPYHPERVIVWNNVALVYSADGNYEKAERLFRDSLFAARRCFSPGDPTLIAVLRNYSEVLSRLHRMEEAARFRAESNAISASALARALKP